MDRKIFFVVASGGHDTDKHYYETIKSKRTVAEAEQFLDNKDINELKNYFSNRPYAVWGSVPGDRNTSTWQSMAPGDYVMIYKNGKIILAAEVAMKVKSPKFARHLWNEDAEGKTWELIYFLINEIEVNLDQKKLNKYLNYSENYFPRGFMAIDQEKANKLLATYGDLISVLQRLEQGEEIEKVDVEKKKVFEELAEDKIEKPSTEHSEMQWRLIRLGNKSNFKVWVPLADRNKHFEDHVFNQYTISEFHETLDVPSYIKNIDTVWKLGLSIKSAFEIEHSTSIYSGILRLSDLKALAPNSNFPLFIVADHNRKNKVFEQLKRPTFSNDYLNLDKIVKFLSYNKVRELDESFKETNTGFNMKWLEEQAESVNN